MTSIGHNTAAPMQLRSLVERIERLNEEKAGIQADIAEVYAECKAFGFDKKIVRKCVQIRAQDSAQRQEEEAILDLYLSALGMKPGDEDATISGAGTPGLARPQPSQAPVGAAAAPEAAAEPPCKPAGPALDGRSTGEAGEAATQSPNPPETAATAPSPPAVEGGAGGEDFPVSSPPAHQPAPDAAFTPADGATAEADEGAASASTADMPDLPAFMDRRSGA